MVRLIACTIFFCLSGSHVALAQAPRYSVEKLADGVHAVIYNPELETEGNTLIVVNDDDVVVVDSNAGTTTAKLTISEIRKLTAKPVTHVINTHWHDDHVYGNQAYAEAFPGVKFVAHPLTRQDIVDHAFANNAFVLDILASDVKRLAGYLETGIGRDGKPLTAETRARTQIGHDKRVEMLRDRKAFVAVPPAVDVAGSITLTRGRRRIEIRFLGRGNTRGDLIVYLPQEQVVATGDLVVAPIPYATNAYVREWVTTLDRLMALPARTILPGHGPVMRDWSYVRQVKSALEQALAGVAAAKKEGLTLQQTVERVQLPAVRDGFVKGVETRKAGYEAFFRTSLVRNAWEELDADLMKAEAASATTMLADGVYARTPREPSANRQEANVVFIVNEKDVVVVDANVTEGAARAAIRSLREMTDKPVRYVVATHAHEGAVGSRVYKEVFPQAEIVAHDSATGAEGNGILVSDEMTLHRGRREIRIVRTRKNENGLIVYLPNERVLMSGESASGLPADTVVPAHGPVVRGVTPSRAAPRQPAREAGRR